MHSSRMRTTRSSSHLQGGSASVHAGIPSPRCGPGDTCRCGPGDLQGMLGYHPPETCKACWDTIPRRPARHAGIPPPGDLQDMLGYHPPETCKACWDTTPSPVNRITDTCKNITQPQLRCGR